MVTSSKNASTLLILACVILLTTIIIEASANRLRYRPRGANSNGPDCRARCQKNNKYGETCNKCCANHPNGFSGNCIGFGKFQMCRCKLGKAKGKPPKRYGMKMNVIPPL